MGGTFALGGLASGMDTKALIDQLMAIEQQPLILIQQKKSALNTKNQLFQTINTRVLAFKGAASELTLDLNMKAKAAATSDAAAMTAKAGPGAAVGTYKIRVDRLATASSLTTQNAISKTLDGTVLGKDLPLSSPLKAGKFTVQYTAGGSTTTKQVTLTQNDIDTKSLDDLVSQINTDLGPELTFAVGAGAQANRLTVTAASATNVIMGASSDTSNFLTATNLRNASFALDGDALGGTMESTYGVGVAQVTSALNTSANWLDNNTAITSGNFKVNGVTISYTNTESLNDVLSRINSSSAGVTATYNTIDDRITLTARSTGSGAISVENGTGNLLSVLGLSDPAKQKLTNGQDAKIGIEGINGFSSGSADQTDLSKDVTSSTNVFTNILPGVTITALKADTAGTSRQTLTISADKEATVGKVKAFVDQYNQLVDAIAEATAKGQPNAFDSDLRQINDHIRAILSSRNTTYPDSPRSLIDLGITTSKTDRVHLTLDTKKFQEAIDANPDRVAELFQLTTADPSDSTKRIDVGLAAKLKTYLTDIGSTYGVFKSRDKSVQKQLRTYDQQITDTSKRMTATRESLVRQFTAMEKAVSRLKSQQSAFLSQLGSLSQG